MSGARSVLGGRLLVAAVLALVTVSGAWAGSKSASSSFGGKSSSSYWQSKSSQPHTSSSLWDRSASQGASPSPFTPSASAASHTGSGGYTKPGAGAAAASVAAPAAAASPSGVSSSGGYTKPGAAAASVAAPAAAASPSGVSSSGGYTKPGAAAAAVAAPAGGLASASAQISQPPRNPAPGGFDRGAERQISSQSYDRYKAEQDRFKTPAQGTLTHSSDYVRNPLYNTSAGRYQSYDHVYAERDAWRASHSWAPSPFAFRSAPSFGMWDALFWWMVLDKITEPSHAAAAYNNFNDPGFQAWRTEANRMAADNAELKAKLDVMDAKLNTLQGQPRVPGTLPDGVPASVALAPAVVVAGQSGGKDLVIGTGGETGNYYPFCQGAGPMHGLRGNLQDFEVQCKVTNGSAENLDGLAAGSLDAILVQSDIFNEWLGRHPGVRLDALKSTVYQEFVQILANKKAGVERIGDLNSRRHWLYLVGSGAQKSWDSFSVIDPRYAEFDRAGRVRRVPNDPQVLEAVAGNPDAVMVFVSGLNTDLLRTANDRYGDKLTMALVDDSRLSGALDRTGHPIYAVSKIPSGLYPKLQKSRWFGMDSSVASLSVGALFILSERWVSGHGVTGLSKVENALWRTIPEIEKKIGAGS